MQDPVAPLAPFAGVDAEDHLDGLRDDPAYALAWHLQQQRIIERQYGHAIASLNLPDAESGKLFELLTARREAVADGRDAAQELGIVGPEAKLAVRQPVEALTEEIKQLVGPAAYYGRIELAPTISTCAGRLQDNVGAGLAAQGEPLTTDQLYSLAADYVGAVYSPAASAGPQDPDIAGGLTPQYRDFLARASATLTAAQLDAFHAFLAEQGKGAADPGASSSARSPQ